MINPPSFPGHPPNAQTSTCRMQEPIQSRMRILNIEIHSPGQCSSWKEFIKTLVCVLTGFATATSLFTHLQPNLLHSWEGLHSAKQAGDFASSSFFPSSIFLQQSNCMWIKILFLFSFLFRPTLPSISKQYYCMQFIFKQNYFNNAAHCDFYLPLSKEKETPTLPMLWALWEKRHKLGNKWILRLLNGIRTV